jgi:hypothetical protein
MVQQQKIHLRNVMLMIDKFYGGEGKLMDHSELLLITIKSRLAAPKKP